MLACRRLAVLALLVLCQGLEEEDGGDSCDNFTDLDLSHCFLGTSLYVRLLLYTSANPTCGRELHHQRFPSQPLFNLSRPTAFVIHGYRPTGAPPIWIDHLVRLLAERRDVNVIVVDWNRGAANLNYLTAVSYTREAAQNLFQMVTRSTVDSWKDVPWSDEPKTRRQICGLRWKPLRTFAHDFVTRRKEPRWTPYTSSASVWGRTLLDLWAPTALPLRLQVWTRPDRSSPAPRRMKGWIRRTPSFGLRGAHGHIDFYANGGADQPGCPKTIFAGKSYFVCDHQRSMFLYLCALNGTCSLTGYPCASYANFLDGRCMQCEAFKPASCPQLGYDVIKWRESLLRLGQTKVFFSTTASHPYMKLNYRVDMVTWNQYLRWGVVYIRLHSGRNVTEARIDNKLLRFEQYTSTRLLAQFDEDLPHVHKISLRINTGNVIGPRYKIRLLRIRLTPLEHPQRPLMCRFDIIVEENTEVAFRPLSCDSRL